LFDLKHGAVAAHGVALPAVAGTTHDETRADAPEEFLGEPIEGHADQADAGDVQPGVSEVAPDALPHAERAAGETTDVKPKPKPRAKK